MPFIGEISALITAILWAGTAIAFTEATKIVGSYVVNITRLLLATAYLVVTILLFNLDYQITDKLSVAAGFNASHYQNDKYYQYYLPEGSSLSFIGEPNYFAFSYFPL